MVKKLETWICDKCNTRFNFESEAEKCENEHPNIEDYEIIKLRFDSSMRCPVEFTVKHGEKELIYKRKGGL
jgi:hypothetical protein